MLSPSIFPKDLCSAFSASQKTGNRTRFAFFFPSAGKKNYCSNQFLNWLQQVSTGHLHLDGFESVAAQKISRPQRGSGDFWCGQQDSNLHALAVEPKSTESTNSTMPADELIIPALWPTERSILRCPLPDGHGQTDPLQSQRRGSSLLNPREPLPDRCLRWCKEARSSFR